MFLSITLENFKYAGTKDLKKTSSSYFRYVCLHNYYNNSVRKDWEIKFEQSVLSSLPGLVL